MAADRPTASPEDVRPPVILGRIGAPHGLLGWVKVQSFTEPLEAIVGYGPWQIARGANHGHRAVLDWKRAGSGLAVRLEGVDTREAAQALTGADVWVERSALPEPGPGEVYWHDLIGLDAISPGGVPLGRVSGILELPAHPVLVLQGGRERLVPLVRERIVRVDLECGRLTLDWHPDD
jgi:16S rRNA processing protein RimM